MFSENIFTKIISYVITWPLIYIHSYVYMVLLKYLKSAEKKESVSVGTVYKSCMFPVSVRQGRVSPTNKFHMFIGKFGNPIQQMQTKAYYL